MLGYTKAISVPILKIQAIAMILLGIYLKRKFLKLMIYLCTHAEGATSPPHFGARCSFY